jgi:hypothetical protein
VLTTYVFCCFGLYCTSGFILFVSILSF